MFHDPSKSDPKNSCILDLRFPFLQAWNGQQIQKVCRLFLNEAILSLIPLHRPDSGEELARKGWDDAPPDH
jgi:hypothetical protein